MKRLSFLSALIVVVLTFAVGTGCRRESPDAKAANAAAQPAPPTPEESFAVIFESFRRGVEEIPIGFVSQDSSGRQTMMTGRNTVSHELFPPQKAGEPFKAKITVKSDTQYSLQQTSEKPDANETNQSDDSSADGSSDVQIFDPNVASAPGASGSRPAAGTVDKNAKLIAKEGSEHEREYELVYEGGRWKLITKLDPNTEESIKIAFDRALDSQS